MKIYTRSGDSGSTGLFAGPRVSKDDDRIESYGTVDELNACLGVVRASGVSETLDQQLQQIQSELFSLGAELATPDPEKHNMRLINETHVARLEQWIDGHEQTLAPLKTFILPAGAASSVQLQLARSVCRRAERRVVTLAQQQELKLSDSLVIYLNRLSDLLFVFARVANQDAGVNDVPWSRS